MKRSSVIVSIALAWWVGLVLGDKVPTGSTPLPQRAFSVAKNDDLLRTVDLTSGATVVSVTMTLAGAKINGGNGLAMHPMDGSLYAILNLQGQSGRELVTIDPSTGVCTGVGNTGDKFAGIAFDSTGTLFGITGDGASTPETLYTISTIDGSPSVLLTLGHGDDGEALGFSPDDGLLYHASGLAEQVYETIDPDTLDVTDIPLSGDDYGEAAVLTYEGLNNFLLTNIDSSLYRVTSAGVVTFAATFDHAVKGLAPIVPQSCKSGPECDDGLFCTGIESCVDGFCRFGPGPCEGQLCDDITETCGCLTDPHCDDEDPCTTDSCSSPDCMYDPVADSDDDGACDAIDNCVQFPNPEQEPALFGHIVLASSQSEFSWGSWAEVVIVWGPFGPEGDVGDYTVNGSTYDFSDRFSHSATPEPGRGLWYLFRPDCRASSWSSGGSGEVPGARDANLP